MTGFFQNAKSFMVWIYACLQGNKSWIFSTITAILLIPDVAKLINQPYYNILMSVIIILAGGSIASHVKKGSFSATKDITEM